MNAENCGSIVLRKMRMTAYEVLILDTGRRDQDVQVIDLRDGYDILIVILRDGHEIVKVTRL
jgi:hypothetical protein